MNDDFIRRWIAKASYEDLLRKWRLAPVGDPFVEGEAGRQIAIRMRELRATIPPAEQVRISKKIGW